VLDVLVVFSVVEVLVVEEVVTDVLLVVLSVLDVVVDELVTDGLLSLVDVVGRVLVSDVLLVVTVVELLVLAVVEVVVTEVLLVVIAVVEVVVTEVLVVVVVVVAHAGFFVCTQPIDSEQVSVVHGSVSSQLRNALPWQVPSRQKSFVVQALPSSQGRWLNGWRHPFFGSHTSSVQKLPSLQSRGDPTQAPAMQ
jgi:hypothetical protein